jgi:hypothetical protein
VVFAQSLLGRGDFSGTFWKSCSFVCTKFTKAILRGAVFKDTVHVMTKFNNANLSGVCMVSSLLDECTFNGTMMVGALFNGCVFQKCDFSGLEAVGIKFVNCFFFACKGREEIDFDRVMDWVDDDPNLMNGELKLGILMNKFPKLETQMSYVRHILFGSVATRNLDLPRRSWPSMHSFPPPLEDTAPLRRTAMLPPRAFPYVRHIVPVAPRTSAPDVITPKARRHVHFPPGAPEKKRGASEPVGNLEPRDLMVELDVHSPISDDPGDWSSDSSSVQSDATVEYPILLDSPGDSADNPIQIDSSGDELIFAMDDPAPLNAATKRALKKLEAYNNPPLKRRVSFNH